ncbi:hypothetical protein [Limnoglobus roseus]|uniref:Endonuclease n=1 Tax=Limnoglobus roseus TaxID=2598579 RepID=A0A5C1AJQ5_9BACT|nr:hypothetical protein [Limnoglobus roseus]QEL17138.1 endonuclease [Limnoglobus roseus]
MKSAKKKASATAKAAPPPPSSPPWERIPLGRGYWMLCDAADYPTLSRYKWRVRVAGNSIRPLTDYRRGRRRTTGGPEAVLLAIPRGHAVAFENFCPLDFRRANLRVVTRAAARARTPRPVRGCPGLCRSSTAGAWVGFYTDANGHRRYLGAFPTRAEAEERVRSAAGNAVPAWVWQALNDPRVNESRRLMLDLRALLDDWMAAPGQPLDGRLWELHVALVREMEGVLKPEPRPGDAGKRAAAKGSPRATSAGPRTREGSPSPSESEKAKGSVSTKAVA